jgi:hypothetical protein
MTGKKLVKSGGTLDFVKERKQAMRYLSLGAVMAAVVAVAPAHAEWKQYQDKSLGIYAYFPVPPARTTTTYKAPLAKEAPATVLTATDEGITYKVEIVDFTTRPQDGANLVGEALGHEVGGRGTTYSVINIPLWDKGANSVYGTAVSIDRQDKDKTHELADTVFNKGKLYIITASVPDASPGRNSPGLARFMDSLQFYMPGYGFNYATGHDYPLDDNDPADRDNHPAAPGYVPPTGLVSGPLKDGPPT